MQTEMKEIPLNKITVKSNYRKTFNDKTLKELANSITENGVLEPILVKKVGSGFYNVIFGERRVRAARIAKLATIPAIIKEVEEQDVLKIQLIENIQREGVPFMEEALGLRDLRDQCDLNISELAQFIGKSEIYVLRTIALTECPPDVQDVFRKGFVSKSVAWHIARLPEHTMQTKAAQDLSRNCKSELITEWTARAYIKRNFSETGLF